METFVTLAVANSFNSIKEAQLNTSYTSAKHCFQTQEIQKRFFKAISFSLLPTNLSKQNLVMNEYHDA